MFFPIFKNKLCNQRSNIMFAFENQTVPYQKLVRAQFPVNFWCVRKFDLSLTVA